LKKINNGATFKQSENKRVESARKRRIENMNDDEKVEYKRKASERKRKSREVKKLKENENTTPEPAVVPYNRPQSFGKAINKSLQGRI
jgi:hypothetical protein